MVEKPSHLKTALSKAETGTEDDAVALLRLCYDHLDDIAGVTEAALFLKQRLAHTPDYRRYQLAGLYVNMDMVDEAFSALVDLAWKDGFAPAQWRLGRMILDKEFDEYEVSTEHGMDLLKTATRAGHLRAAAEWHGHMARVSAFPLSLYHWFRYRIFVFKTVWHRDIKGHKDQSVL